MSRQKLSFSKKPRGRPPKPAKGVIGKRVRQLREKAGLTTTELGKLVESSHVTITHIETGQTTPSGRILRLLEQVFNEDFGLKDRVGGFSANPAESEFLSYFRLLPPDRQQLLIRIAQGYVQGLPAKSPPRKIPAVVRDQRKEKAG